jgi:hypothetical protein
MGNMRPLSRRARWLAVTGAGLAAMAGGALPVLLASGHSGPPPAQVRASGIVAANPEDGLTPGDPSTPDTAAATPATTVTTAKPTTTSAAPTTTTATTAPVDWCQKDGLSITVSTTAANDAATEAVSLTNLSDRPCRVTQAGAADSGVAECDPWVDLDHHDAADQYTDTVFQAYATGCVRPEPILAPGQTVTRTIGIPFGPMSGCIPEPTAAGHCAVRVTWPTGGSLAGHDPLVVVLPLSCPPSACAPPASGTTSTSTSTTPTSPSSSTTTSTTTSSTTATTR